MYCNCQCKSRKIIKSTKVEVDGKKVTVSFPKTTLKNNEEFDLIIIQTIPKKVLGATVEFSNGDTIVDALNRNGNLLMGERLGGRTMYRAVYGDKDSEHILIRGCLPINPNATEAE